MGFQHVPCKIPAQAGKKDSTSLQKLLLLLAGTGSLFSFYREGQKHTMKVKAWSQCTEEKCSCQPPFPKQTWRKECPAVFVPWSPHYYQPSLLPPCVKLNLVEVKYGKKLSSHHREGTMQSYKLSQKVPCTFLKNSAQTGSVLWEEAGLRQESEVTRECFLLPFWTSKRVLWYHHICAHWGKGMKARLRGRRGEPNTRMKPHETDYPHLCVLPHAVAAWHCRNSHRCACTLSRNQGQ